MKNAIALLILSLVFASCKTAERGVPVERFQDKRGDIEFDILASVADFDEPLVLTFVITYKGDFLYEFFTSQNDSPGTTRHHSIDGLEVLVTRRGGFGSIDSVEIKKDGFYEGIIFSDGQYKFMDRKIADFMQGSNE